MSEPVMLPPRKISLAEEIEAASEGLFAKAQSPAERAAAERSDPPPTTASKPAAAPAPAPAPVTATTPPPSAPEEHDAEMPEIKSPEGKRTWKVYKEGVKKKIDEYETKLKEFESKLAKAPSEETLKTYQEKVATFEKERTTLLTELEKASLERTPAFRAHYIEKNEKLINEAKALVPDKAAAVEEILRLPEGRHKNAALGEFIADLDELQKMELAVIARSQRETDGERRAAIDDWKKQREYEAEHIKEQAARTQKEREQVFEAILAEERKSNAALQMRDKDEAWNTEIATRLGAAKQLLNGEGTIEERSRAALRAVTLPLVAKQAIALQEEIKRLTEQLETFRAKSPPVDGKGGQEAPTPTEKKSAIDIVMEQVHNSGFGLK